MVRSYVLDPLENSCVDARSGGFLVGVDLEEAGEKWRAGDAAKSARFFLKAIDNYQTGIQSFPEDFNLVYNL